MHLLVQFYSKINHLVSSGTALAMENHGVGSGGAVLALPKALDVKDSKMFDLTGAEQTNPRAEGSLHRSDSRTTLSPVSPHYSRGAESIPAVLRRAVSPLAKHSDVYFTTACFYMCAASTLSRRHF